MSGVGVGAGGGEAASPWLRMWRSCDSRTSDELLDSAALDRRRGGAPVVVVVVEVAVFVVVVVPSIST